MNFIMGNKLECMTVDMKVVKMLSKISEYKGRQLIYNKRQKDILESLSRIAVVEYAHNSCSHYLQNNDELNLGKLINNEVVPKNREEIGIVEYRDALKTINSAYEDIKITPQTILELHGYLHKFSLIRGGKYRIENLTIENLCYNGENISLETLDAKEIDMYIENLCTCYNNLVEKDEVDYLIIISTFILEFILIHPFRDDNIKMAKILLLLLLNKNGYEVGIYMNLGGIFEENFENYCKALINGKESISKEEYDINEWIQYLLQFVLDAYEKLDDKLEIVDKKKQTKTNRIEKIINSTLGYFTKDDIKTLCPDIPEPTINRVFNNLRKQDKIEVVARGRSAKWKKKY